MVQQMAEMHLQRLRQPVINEQSARVGALMQHVLAGDTGSIKEVRRMIGSHADPAVRQALYQNAFNSALGRTEGQLEPAMRALRALGVPQEELVGLQEKMLSVERTKAASQGEVAQAVFNLLAGESMIPGSGLREAARALAGQHFGGQGGPQSLAEKFQQFKAGGGGGEAAEEIPGAKEARRKKALDTSYPTHGAAGFNPPPGAPKDFEERERIRREQMTARERKEEDDRELGLKRG
ncbi:MAG: hypothetical protein FJ290_14735 [Planctomycetes bacterium]|nr:hypothetical protein [Planctomycetota bacterium]